MSPRLGAPVLTVDAGKMHQIDTRNVENLHSMWTEAVEEGRRLENLSWRIWNRETFCCDHRHHNAADLDRTRLHPCQQQSVRSIPELSSSVDSAVSDDIESRMTRSSRQYSPPLAIQRLDSSRSSLSGLGSSARERHISSFALERMVMSIKERKNPKEALPAHVVDAIPAATASAPSSIYNTNTATPAVSGSTAARLVAVDSRRCDETRSSRSSDSTAPLSSTSSRGSRRMDSDTSADSVMMPKHNVVRGFAIGQPSSYRSSPQASSPIPAKSLAVENKKKGIFMLPSSKSSGEDESSLDTRMSTSRGPALPSKSSLTSQIKRAPTEPKKTTSFKDVVQERTFADEDVFESSDDDDEDGAIEDDSDVDDDDEDDDAEEWESGSESESEEPKPPVFKRIDSKATLTSRRSLLTTMMNETDRAAAMQDMASQLHSSKSQPQLQRANRVKTASPLSQASTAVNSNQSIKAGGEQQQQQRNGSKPIAMPSSPSSAAIALSPRTTRRNMLAAELTESLRTHLLHERAMKNKTLAASKKGIVRRHTAQGNLSELKQFPRTGQHGRSMGACDNLDEDEPWQKGIFGQGALGEYHERGW